MALTRVTTWSAGNVLTASALNGEFNNILNNALSLISPLTGNLACGDNDLTGIDELAFTSGGAAATASGRLRRNARVLSWHDGDTACTLPVVLARDVETFTHHTSIAAGTAFTFSVPANTLLANRMLRLTLIGSYLNNNAATADLTVTVTFGSTTLMTATFTNIPNSASNRSLSIRSVISANNTTSAQASMSEAVMSGAGALALAADIPNGAGSIANAYQLAYATATEDTTAAKTLLVQVQHDASSANQSVSIYAAHLELL